jgi:hypothetical protein
MIFLRQSTASQEVPLGCFVSSSDGNTETTPTIANTDIKVWKTGATTLSNKNSGGSTNISNGVQYAVLDATDTDTIGPLRLFVHVTGSLPVMVACCVLDEAVYDALFGTSALATVGGAVASVTGAVGSVTGAVGSVTGNVGGNVVGSVASVTGAVGSVTGSVGSVTGNVGGNVVGSVAQVAGNVGGSVASVTGNVGGNVVGTVASVVGSVASVTGAVASVTGNVGGNVLGNVNGNVVGSIASVAAGGISAASLNADTGLVPIRSATAAAAASGTITLDGSASALDDFYRGCIVRITGSSGAPTAADQIRLITTYVGSTRVATIDKPWALTPSGTITYMIVPLRQLLTADFWAMAMTELTTGVPTWTAPILDAIRWLFALSRNQIEQTASATVVRRDDGSTQLASSSTTDNGTTLTRGEWI